MKPRISLWLSLKVRLTVFTLAAFVLGIWSLSFYISRSLQADMEQLLGEQQMSVVTAVAKEVNDNLTDRLKALETVANDMDAALLGNPAALQARLEQRPLLQLLFNGGVWVAGLDGTAIADMPLSTHRIGINFMDQDFVVAALKEGKPTISSPVMGKQLKAPIFAIAVPVRDAQGRVIGVLTGTTNLGMPSFLDKITQNTYGKTGGYLLIAPQARLVITATDKKRIMEVLPAPGINRYVDRNIAGYEGYSVLVNARGEEQLASVKQIPVSGWYVLLGTPTVEAFAPLHEWQRRFLWATLLLSMLTGVLTWLVLRRELAPLAETASAMAALADTRQMPQPLALTQQDEVGQLVSGFNRILQTWAQREAVLKESQQNLAVTLNSIGDAVMATDAAGLVTRMNPAAERLTGWSLADALGQPLTDVFRIISALTRLPAQNPVQLVMAHGEVVGLANHTTLLARGGREYQIADSAAPIRNAANDILGVVLVFSDVSEQYRVALSLKDSEQRYRSLLENLSSGVVVHRADTTVEMANAMAAHLLGLTQDQMMGKAALDPDWRFVREDGTPMPLDDYPVNRVLSSGEPLRNFVVGVCQHGCAEPTWVICNAYAQRDADGNLLQVVVTFTDITPHKQAELALQRSRVMMERTENLARLASFEWQVDTNQVTWSPEMFRLFGRDPALGTPNLQGQAHLYTPESTQKLFDAVGKALADGTPYTLELMTVQPDGAQRPCIAKGFPERDASGRVVRLVGLVQDITERKQAQEKLQLAASVFTHAQEGIMITAPDATIIDTNDTFTRITGYSREEAVGQKPSMLKSGRHDRDFYVALWSALTEQGHWRGEVWNRRKNGDVFAGLLTISSVQDAAGNTQQYVALFSDITASKEHQSRLEHVAHFDALTNLPNRVLLADRLQQAMVQAQRRQKQVAVAFLDLDGFKAINDQYGHITGDQLLITLAMRMKGALREGDTLARIGGDEFVAVLIDLEDSSACVPQLSRLLAAAALPVQVDDLAPQVSASVGVTFYPQSQDIDADQLMRQADQAMYQAKVAGKNRYCVFDAAQDSSIRVHFESLERIRLALENHELVLYYQPKVNMHSGQVRGVEALIRWQHPEQGLLAPAAFLPVIEDHPLAVAVGEWVIDTALTQIERWHAVGLDLSVSVNIGARQLQQADFVQHLQAILARHPQVDPSSLEIELLETSVLADMAQVSQVIEDCGRMGITFALDDFGTGYSSLTYLKRLRVTLLKIDQSFVRDMLDDSDDLAILQGIIGLAAAFRREVIAEGVETVAHGTALLQLGCELAQGYGIARPMLPSQLPAWVASWQPDAAWVGHQSLFFRNGQPRSIDLPDGSFPR